jgi:hypothetical protein
MLRKFAGVLGLAALLTSFATPSAKPADNGVPFPGGYLDWFLVNAMTAGKDSPVFGGVNAVHLIHVNPKGFATLKSTGPFPYPDGTIFADDGHDFTVKNGATIEGQAICHSDGERFQEVCGHRRLGLPGVRRRRSLKAANP